LCYKDRIAEGIPQEIGGVFVITEKPQN